MLMSINETAKELGLSGAHVRKMVKKGVWPSYSFGKKAVRLDVDEIRKMGRLIAESKRSMADGR